MKKMTVRTLPLLLLLGTLTLGNGMAMAEDNNPMAAAAHGAGDVATGITNVLVTPAVMLNDLANGRADSFIADTFTMPVRAVVSTGAGVVEVIGGLGGGMSQATGNFLNGAADAAKNVSNGINADSPAAKLLTTP